VSSPGLLGGFGSWAAVRHHKHNLPHLGKLTIRVAINRNVNALDDAANLATMRAMMNIHIRLPRCLGLWAETRRRSKKPWPKSERANGKSGTKVLRLAKETASRRLK
jgi:hypothetical protein